MYKLRVISYSPNSVSIQVYTIVNRKRKIVRHIGTANNDQQKEQLIRLGYDFIKKATNQLTLFNEPNSGKIVNLSQAKFVGVYYTFFRELFHRIFIGIGFDKLKAELLLELCIIRLFEPASKLRSIQLIEQHFGFKYRRQSYYESAREWLDLKGKTEKIAIDFAKRHYGFSYDILFYDVTTLYYESFQEDELRKNGFSKDNKSQQPQILVALMVSKEGLPVAYEVFSGSTFEGHTIIPVVKKFIEKNNVKEFTIVADAAMISSENIENLLSSKIHYIVGARLGNISKELFDTIDKTLIREDGKTIRVKTDHGFLICSYSTTRFKKDKYEMEKQIQKARAIINNPTKNRKVKFVTSNNKDQFELNQGLVAKTQKLLGVKGYYTDLSENMANNNIIIERYHELYRIEQNFRIVKSDLKTRPIFHFKEEPIKLHLLICFISLVVSKHIELSTGISIKKFTDECKKVTDVRLVNKITNQEVRMRAEIRPDFTKILAKILPLT
jgi:transposase